MVLGPGGRYPRMQAGPPQPGDDPRIHASRLRHLDSSSFSVRPSRLVLSARSAGMSAGSAASVIGWLVLQFSGHHKLHRSYGSDQATMASLVKQLASSILQILDPQTVRFHRTEHLLDSPPHTIPGDNLAGLFQRRDRVRGQQPPVHAFHPLGRIDFLDIDDQSETVSGWPLSEEFAGHFRLTGP